MLWNIIYDFFVHHVFGGVDSELEYFNGALGEAHIYSNGDFLDTYGSGTSSLFISTFFQAEGYTTADKLYLPLGSYLSLLASIITIVAIVLFCVFIIKKIIGIIFRLFTGSSSF